MLTRLLLTTKSFRSSLLNHFISNVLHDSFSFRCEILANGPRLRQARFRYFLPNLLLRMHRNGHKTTSGVKFNLKFDFPVPDFLYGKML